MGETKLPKQWKHWCADQRLTVHGGKRDMCQSQWLYLKGRGHYWRVNCFGMFQRGDTYEDFDRWALCEIKEVPLPKTRAEFRSAISLLLKDHIAEPRSQTTSQISCSTNVLRNGG